MRYQPRTGEKRQVFSVFTTLTDNRRPFWWNAEIMEVWPSFLAFGDKWWTISLFYSRSHSSSYLGTCLPSDCVCGCHLLSHRNPRILLARLRWRSSKFQPLCELEWILGVGFVLLAICKHLVGQTDFLAISMKMANTKCKSLQSNCHRVKEFKQILWIKKIFNPCNWFVWLTLSDVAAVPPVPSPPLLSPRPSSPASYGPRLSKPFFFYCNSVCW